MKNLLVHGVYLSVIAVLSFLLYDKTKTDDFVFMKSSEMLEESFKLTAKIGDGVLKNIKQSIDASPQYHQYLTTALKCLKVSYNLDSFTNILKVKKSLTNNDISLLKKKVEEQIQMRNLLISDSLDKKELDKTSLLPKLLADNVFWSKINKTSRLGFINQLNIIKSGCLEDKMSLLFYCDEKSSGKVSTNCGFGLRVAIAPKKAILVEGEDMQAELYITEYKKYSGNELSFEVNQKSIEVKEGVAIFKEYKPKIGENKIRVTATLKNLFTGGTETTLGELSYEVLPKCSRDCAKNQ
jgi:hypothetical protein